MRKRSRTNSAASGPQVGDTLREHTLALATEHLQGLDGMAGHHVPMNQWLCKSLRKHTMD